MEVNDARTVRRIQHPRDSRTKRLPFDRRMQDVPRVKTMYSNFETVALAYRHIGLLDIVVYRRNTPKTGVRQASPRGFLAAVSRLV